MASNTVIVFGPTGGVASTASVKAHEDGAKVFLAMRDPSKSIPGLSAEQEKSGGYERLQADLTQPDTVSAAVKKSGAKSAFIYLAHMSQDHMKATIQALKDSGIDFVVFLSSYTILEGKLEDVPQTEMIPFMHAQVEINLEAIYGSENYVAVRPGGFATNVMYWKKGIEKGEVKLYCPEAKFDYIAPDDMGRVSGAILAGKHGDETIVPLFGPEMTSQEEAVNAISKALGREIKVTHVGPEAMEEEYKAIGMPPPIASYLVSRVGQVGEGIGASHPKLYEQGVANIEKYTGKPAKNFETWAEENKQLFTA